MATNFFFNNFQSSMEQNLIEDLVVESIKIYGIDLYYLPKRVLNRDTIFREEELATYNTAHPIEMYIKNVSRFAIELPLLFLVVVLLVKFLHKKQTWYDH